ncbi:MAG: tRNA-dihydrouridine synthase, partial [Candidatus Paceibacter sp.]|nr:tRNA-dihydrouridine synthase [Candidatus Paceibacter sp.]
MNFGFWKDIKKPFFVLAPMADVTDAAFRRVIAKYGKPDVTWTEFVSADGLIRATEIGKQKLMRDLVYSEGERPIVAQLFGSHPEYMKQAAALVQELGFDGIDINMGCPDSGIEKQGAGAAMIRNPAKAREIIRAAKEGAPKLPVSVKTRVGYNKNELETWLPELLAEEPALITIHARTRKEMSKVPARWEHVKRAVEIRNELGKKTLIAGNGDVLDLADARKKVEETGADGVMLGRAIFGNPWLFEELNIHRLADSAPPSKEEGLKHRSVESSRTLANQQSFNEGHSPFEGSGRRPRDVFQKLNVMLEHTKLFVELLGDIKNF